MKDRIPRFEYRVSNESLRAIVRGLNISRKDAIVSICGGGGDAVFAIGEKAREILVVDKEREQLDYFIHRLGLLFIEDYKGFLEPPGSPTNDHEQEDLSLRNKYFSIERLKQVRKNMLSAHVELKLGDILNLDLPSNRYNKINLSNCLSYDNDLSGSERLERLENLARILPRSGLIYTSDGKFTLNRAVVMGEDIEVILRKLSLIINPRLNSLAQKLQRETSLFWDIFWQPIIFQKGESK